MADSAAGQPTQVLTEQNPRVIMCAPGGKNDPST
jgi:hypothetical protein